MYELEEIDGTFAVCKLKKETEVKGNFFFYSVTDSEISLVCKSEDAPEDALEKEDGRKALRFSGKLDFSLTGVLAEITKALAEAKIGIFAVSTYDTDYILVKETDFEKAKESLPLCGYKIKNGQKG